MNDGFVLRGTLFRTSARVREDLRQNMDDRNHWYEYLLARDPQDPKQYPGLSRFSTNLFPKSSHQYPREADDSFATFDTTDAVRSRHATQASSGSMSSRRLVVEPERKFKPQLADWNSSSGVTPRSLECRISSAILSIQFSGGGQNGRVPAGLYRFLRSSHRRVLAEVTSNGSYSVNANALGHGRPDRALRESAQRPIVPSAFWTQHGPLATSTWIEIMERFSVTKRFRSMAFHRRRLLRLRRHLRSQTSGGRTASPLVEQPRPVSIVWIPATAATAPAGTPAAALTAVQGWNGRAVQLTNPEGFTALGVATRARATRGSSRISSATSGTSRRLGVDWGFRSENFVVKGSNQTGFAERARQLGSDLRGADGDPFTMFDNRFTVPNPNGKWNSTRTPQLLVVRRDELRDQ